MAFLNYTDPVPIPAPLTSGSTIQSYTDPMGDVWVAKNGVNGGRYLRARDVLHAKYGRTTSYTYIQSTPTAIPFNSVVRDPYGLWVSASNGFQAPIGGLWSAHTQLCIAFTATGQFIGLYLNMGAAAAVRTNQYAGPAGSTNEYVQGHDCVSINAGDLMVVQGYSGTASLVSAGNTASDIYFSVKYEGTG